jgi:hypothetical protein
MWSGLKRDLKRPAVRSLVLLVFLILALALAFQQISQKQVYQKQAAAANPKCYQPCGEDTECNGLICGKSWCPPGSSCHQLLRCHQAACPFDRNCRCRD